MPGVCTPALAEGFATPILGAISGGFFTNDPLIPPAAPSASALLPAAMPGPDLCGPAVASASASHGLPDGLLTAIAVVESGRINPRTSRVTPWPWTIDADGAGAVYPTKLAAEQAASAFEAAGITSLDVGCLQVNLAQHPDAFQTLAEAFDPAANANYAAGFLTSLEQKFGSWQQAVAAYHSQTPAYGGPYAARVYAQWQPGAPPVLAAAVMQGHGQQMPETLLPASALPSTALAMSSLIPPMPMLLHADREMTGRSLASYRAAPIAIATSGLPPSEMPPSLAPSG